MISQQDSAVSQLTVQSSKNKFQMETVLETHLTVAKQSSKSQHLVPV